MAHIDMNNQCNMGNEPIERSIYQCSRNCTIGLYKPGSEPRQPKCSTEATAVTHFGMGKDLTKYR